MPFCFCKSHFRSVGKVVGIGKNKHGPENIWIFSACREERPRLQRLTRNDPGMAY